MASVPPTCATSWTSPTQFTPPATVVTLEQNYRSTEPILAASNAVIGLARERFTKNLRSTRASDTRAVAGDGRR